MALAEARSLGKADPSIIDQFNRLAPGCDRLDAALDDATCGAEARATLFDSTCFGVQAPAGGDQQRRIFRRSGAPGDACAPIRDGVGATFYGTCDPVAAFCCYEDPSAPELGCTFPFTADGEPRQGTCQATADVGAPCAFATPLQFCATGNICNDSGTCIAEPNEILETGELCVESFVILGQCTGGYCDLFGTGNCEALRANGEACLGPEECVNGACVDGTCGDNTFCGPSAPTADAGPGNADAGPGQFDAGSVDLDAGNVDAGNVDAGNVDAGPLSLSGERCDVAPRLDEVSTSLPAGSTYSNVVTGAFGETNDYNPYQDAEPQLPPACSIVFDAAGAEVVYALTLNPGETLDLEYSVEPFNLRPAVYLLDGCGTAPSSPDFDASGACGSNEYATAPFCIAGCGPLAHSFTYPAVVNGQPTAAQTFFLVLDTLNATGTSFELRWRRF